VRSVSACFRFASGKANKPYKTNRYKIFENRRAEQRRKRSHNAPIRNELTRERAPGGLHTHKHVQRNSTSSATSSISLVGIVVLGQR
jgi:hypothetical protein